MKNSYNDSYSDGYAAGYSDGKTSGIEEMAKGVAAQAAEIERLRTALAADGYVVVARDELAEANTNIIEAMTAAIKAERSTGGAVGMTMENCWRVENRAALAAYRAMIAAAEKESTDGGDNG